MGLIGGEIVSFLWSSGLTGRAIASLGVLSLALSIASSLTIVIPPWRRASRRVGAITLLTAAATLFLAAASSAAHRADADALEGAAAPSAHPLIKAQRDKYTQARVVALGALLLAAPALVAGAGAALSSGGVNLGPTRTRRRAAAPPATPAPKQAPKAAWPLFLAIAAAIVAALLAASAARAPIPGDELGASSGDGQLWSAWVPWYALVSEGSHASGTLLPRFGLRLVRCPLPARRLRAP